VRFRDRGMYGKPVELYIGIEVAQTRVEATRWE
jgi:hypothetical protein